MRMKVILMLYTCIFCLSAFSQKPLFDQKAGSLRLTIDKTGRITTLEDVSKGTNYIATDEASYLLECNKYLADSSTVMFHPESMKIIKQTQAGTKIELTFKEGVKLIVFIIPKKDYFRMELIGADPVSDISQVSWGPYKTRMRGLVGDVIGFNRSNNFSIGLMSLEPNTDGYISNYNAVAASYTDKGSAMQLTAFDQTRGRFVKYADNGHEKLRTALPVPDLTVIGSSVALLGCPTGKVSELTTIEKVELGEGLPNPTLKGKWNKYSEEAKKLAIWAYNCDEKNFDEYLKISKEMGASILCRNTGFFKNWGHFDFDEKICPSGIDGIAADSKQAKNDGIGLSLYTLTTFLKPMTGPEPYLTPVPDERLVTWKPQAKLTNDLSVNEKELSLQKNDELLEVLNAESNKVIRIGDEIIEFKSFIVNGNEIIAKECERGAFYTKAVTHKKESTVRLMVVSGFHNFYPGTLDFSNDFSDRFWEILSKADLDLFITDGFESCLEMGYGYLGGNIFMRNFYNKCVENKKEILFSGSGWSNYTWHIFSHFTWGENDWERGFRGTQLDARLSSQIQLRNNLMPNKLGQYYPENATVEDIEWVLALSTGWDAGVDFQLTDLNKMRTNPDYKKIIQTMKLWKQARAENTFTEQQKMALRQTDVQYKLSRKADGGWDLKFDHFWKNNNVKVLQSSVMAAKAVNGEIGSVKPCSIDWSWTHNPAVSDEVVLSDDLIQRTGIKETSWTVSCPVYTESTKSYFPTSKRYFQFVIRLPKDAPCAVKNFKVSINNKVVEIPVTLQPGQYLSTPHLTEWACVYNEKNEVVGEVYFRSKLPKVAKGTTARVSLSYEPVDAKVNPEVILNVRCQNGFFF